MANKRLNYVDGVSPAVARRLLNFVFGEDFIRMDVNDERYTYDVYVKPEIDKDMIEDFKNFWGNAYRFLVQNVVNKS